MKFVTWPPPILPQETLGEKGEVRNRHYYSFRKGLDCVVTAKGSKVMAQNVNEGLA